MPDFSSPSVNLLSVFNSLPGVYLLLSPEFKILAVSDLFLEATLTKRENIIGAFLFEAFPENPQTPEAQGANNLRTSLERVLATGKPHEMARLHYDIPDPDNPGKFIPRYVLPVNTPVLDEQGKVVQIIHKANNITDNVNGDRLLLESQRREQEAIAQIKTELLTRQQMENQQTEVLAYAKHLALEREKFYQIFEQTPAAICIQRGPEHRYEYLNSAYQQLFPGRQFYGRTVTEAIPETVAGGFVALLDQVYQTGEPYFGHESPLLVEDTDGGPSREMFFTFTYQAFRENGQIAGISTFAYEVTEQVVARKQRDLQQQRLHEIFEQAPVAIAVFRNPEHIIEVFNPRMAALMDRTSNQVLGKPLFEALPELRDQGFRELLDTVVQTGTPYVALEKLAIVRRRGELDNVYVDFVYHPLKNEQGKNVGVIVIATEITEQVKSKKQLALANQELTGMVTDLDNTNLQLTRTNIDLDNFIYAASHDLKTPILNIEGLMEALVEHLSTDSVQDASIQRILYMIGESIKRFKRTIEHLTEISKLQKEHSQEFSAVNLATVLADVQLDLAPAIQNSQVQIEVDISQCATIHFSEKNLRSILQNLLSNAIKYHSPDRVPVVRITCLPSENFKVLSIQDNGLGVDASQHQKLFNMFQRFHDHVEGSGIGLYMVKKIIENAGGKIEVESQLNEGSTFRVYFPIRA